MAILDKAQEKLAEAKSRKSPEPSAMLASADVVMTPPEEEGDVKFYPGVASKHHHSPTTPKTTAAAAASVFLSPSSPGTSYM